MPEYIEREATVKLLRSLGNRDYRREKGTIQDAIKMVSYSGYTPAADVAPVVHGRWIQVDDTKCKCSECEVITLIAQYPHGDKNYCPNCGAKMDGGTA